MSRWMYNPETDKRNGKKFQYDLPIHENDEMLVGFTYRQIIDEVIANYGHNATEKQLRQQIQDHLDMAKENLIENLMLCKANMLEEIKER